MGKSKVDPAVMKNGGMQCLHCGDTHILPLPMGMLEAADLMMSFSKRHAKCEKTWSRPVVDPKQPLPFRIKWWLTAGEQGFSSIAIYNRMMPEYKIYDIHGEGKGHPYDAHDFRRCYLLLKTIPEWKERLELMCDVSPIWDKLVSNWDKLTYLFETSIASVPQDGTEFYKLLKELITT